MYTYINLLICIYIYIVRTMLEAIISFLPSEGGGAIGSLEYSKAERQRLAKEVRYMFIHVYVIYSEVKRQRLAKEVFNLYIHDNICIRKTVVMMTMMMMIFAYV
jgi:hypothetical protein